MHKVAFFPIGNADCCRVDLEKGPKLLFDYADMRDPADPEDRRIALGDELRRDLEEAGRDAFDVVGFTHLDDDHIHGASEFFSLDHAAKYQGGKRIKIRDLWVPAAAITEEGLEDEARIIRTEARFRLEKGYGVRVFSRPDRLREWLKARNIRLEDRAHLITDAGQLVPGFRKDTEGVEFFIHSPFARRLDDGGIEDRNSDALVLQGWFSCGTVDTKLLLTADAPHEILTEIVQITQRHKNDSRLEWDIYNVPHHCSHLSLGPERGKDVTEPVSDVEWLIEAQGQDRGIVVSTSKVIPKRDDDPQPPHRQAANYYKEATAKRKGQFIVTMEHPSTDRPRPLEITIDTLKATVKRTASGGSAAILTSSAPRAGMRHGR